MHGWTGGWEEFANNPKANGSGQHLVSRGVNMTDDQVSRIVQHLCEQLHVTIRLKGSEAHPPNAKDIGFDLASVNAVLRTGLRLAGVAVVDRSLTKTGEEPPWA
jgi:hypothetical protein